MASTSYNYAQSGNYPMSSGPHSGTFPMSSGPQSGNYAMSSGPQSGNYAISSGPQSGRLNTPANTGLGSPLDTSGYRETERRKVSSVVVGEELLGQIPEEQVRY
eukprot:Trichotokara_eunicae@DN8042_c0_g1_i1.p1